MRWFAKKGRDGWDKTYLCAKNDTMEDGEFSFLVLLELREGNSLGYQVLPSLNKVAHLRRFPLNVRAVSAKYLQHCHILRTDKKNLSLLLLPS